MAASSYLSIERAPNKTTYQVGDKFERYGMIVKAHYDDGTSNTIDFYFINPSTPLSINDTQVTISFMDKSVSQTISVNNPPSTGYFINKCLDNANYGNNPYVNTVDGSISFYNNPITVERDSYQLNVVLSYHSRMSDKESDLIKGFYKGFRTNYHQFLVKDGKDNDTKDIIRGSTIGVQYEWLVHNVAYFLGIMPSRADPVEIGKTIYTKNTLGVSIVLGASYPIVLNLLVPQPFNVFILLFDSFKSI